MMKNATKSFEDRILRLRSALDQIGFGQLGLFMAREFARQAVDNDTKLAAREAGRLKRDKGDAK